MEQEPDLQSIRKQIDSELSDIHFDEQMQRAVLNKTRPASFWNRELRIPGLAASIILCILIAVPAIGWHRLTSLPSPLITKNEKLQLQDELIILAGGAFYESELLEGWPQAK